MVVLHFYFLNLIIDYKLIYHEKNLVYSGDFRDFFYWM